MSASDPIPTRTAPPSRKHWRIWATAAAALVLGIAAILVALHRRPEAVSIPYFPTLQNIVRPPLPYRIVSFHRGRADKNLIRLAAQLGFNGVQFQIEGSNESGIKDFAARDQKEHLIDFCHSLGMQVTVWVHEISDLPSWSSPAYPGTVSVDNEKVWALIDKRYEWILGQALPNIDGLVLTTVETQFKATDTPLLLKLVNLIDQKCRQHGKTLIVRTFVWLPDELEGVMGAVKRIPDDIVIMCKAVPQDWQMRGGNAAEIGAVGDHPQIVEYDVAGEYFLLNNVANCMVDRLKTQFDYGLTKNVRGICVRVDRLDGSLPTDRDNGSVLFEPNEVNLWALGLLAAGATSDPEEIWKRWAAYRYGEKAAPAVIAALKPTSEVVAEMLSVGPFTYGDTRGTLLKGAPSYYVPLPYTDLMGELSSSNLNWQMWRWDPQSLPIRMKIDNGDPLFIDELRKQKTAALEIAIQCLADLERAKPLLPVNEYQILYTKLLSNKVQLEYRTQAALAALHYRQIGAATTQAQADEAFALYNKDLDAVRALADSLKAYPKATTFDYLGKHWQVNYPLAISPEQLTDWLKSATITLAPIEDPYSSEEPYPSDY